METLIPETAYRKPNNTKEKLLVPRIMTTLEKAKNTLPLSEDDKNVIKDKMEKLDEILETKLKTLSAYNISIDKSRVYTT